MSGYRCPECGGMGSAPTHRPECSRREMTLTQLALFDAVRPGRPVPGPWQKPENRWFARRAAAS